jgi:2-phosphoglycerate kinase
MIAGQTGILVRSARRAGPPDPADWAQAVPIGTARRERAGIVAETYVLYRVLAKPHAPAVILPGRAPG